MMTMKIFVFSCLVATGFTHPFVRPKCKIETVELTAKDCVLEPTKVCGAEADGKVIFQEIARDKPVCADIVDKICFPALKAEDSCKERTRNVCIPSFKIVDIESGKIPEPFQDEKYCRLIPKGKCEDHVEKIPKKVCEPVELEEVLLV